MFSQQELEQFKRVCASIGDAATDETGFVPIRSLIAEFKAELLLRPLLVEGMLAHRESGSPTGFSRTWWLVLVDSETYPISESDIHNENVSRPLPVRFRNTVAHELVHSLAFRPSEFGIRLHKKNSSGKSKAAWVEEIEQETEKFSPLLLWPESSLGQALAGITHTLTAEELVGIMQRAGVSRYVLINRLRLLPASHKFRIHPALRNLAVGIGEWSSDGNALIKSWPLFLNFDNNIVPTFLFGVRKRDKVTLGSMLGLETANIPENLVALQVEAGTPLASVAERMQVEVLLEPTNKGSGKTFLFVVRRSPSSLAVNLPEDFQ